MDEKTKELLLFTINGKAVETSSLFLKDNITLERKEFLKGQFAAFNEMYSLVKNM